MKGIDIPIESLRSFYETNLWNGNNTTFYGRIFRIKKGNDIIPMDYKGGIDYRDTLLDDKKDAICFFDVLPDEDLYNPTVWIQYAVNLKKLYPSVTERATEYAHEDAINATRLGSPGTKITGIVRGLPAFEPYAMVKDRDDYQPYYLFRLNCTIKYNLKC